MASRAVLGSKRMHELVVSDVTCTPQPLTTCSCVGICGPSRPQDISQNPQVVVLKYNLDTHIQKATALMNKYLESWRQYDTVYNLWNPQKKQVRACVCVCVRVCLCLCPCASAKTTSCASRHPLTCVPSTHDPPLPTAGPGEAR
jgi:hypothetical protein